MALTSARFEGNERLERCAAGDFAARLTPGTKGDFVALVQQALMDLGESLPNFGADGGYGNETTAAVLSYKTRHDIRTDDGVLDGIVGPKTIAKLDEECTARDQVPGPCPPEPDGPAVDLLGADEQLVNMVLANTLAARVVGVDGDGGTRLLTGGVEGVEPAAGEVVSAAAALLATEGPEALQQLVGSLANLGAAFGAAGDADTASAFVGSRWVPVDIGPALGKALIDLLNNLAAGKGAPVRDLTKPAALLEAELHHAQGRIVLDPPPPASGGKPLDPKQKFAIASKVAGVEYKITQFGDKRLPSYKPVSQRLIGLDIRHVVGLVRLAIHLSSTWGVTEIHHVGISGDSSRADCHGNGRACDFVGVVGTRDGAAFHLTVFNDWKNRSVPNLANPSKPRLPDWPPVTRTLEYRLATLPGVDVFARDFFQNLYDWVAGQYQDRTDGPNQIDPPSRIGESSRIMTPDHPTSKPGTKNGREAHHSHMHWQVGPTGPQAP
ncbi:MAG TPA: peptidoglycan-binding protein [Thermoleophilaceae bacterium]|jgi:hypothetical protein